LNSSCSEGALKTGIGQLNQLLLAEEP